jgi:hypothetical protein
MTGKDEISDETSCRQLILLGLTIFLSLQLWAEYQKLQYRKRQNSLIYWQETRLTTKQHTVMFNGRDRTILRKVHETVNWAKG